MKRKLFFWLEKLRITPSERKAVVVLLGMLTAVGALRLYLPERGSYNKAYYREANAEFLKRSQELRRQQAAIMSRYNPDGNEYSAKIDTIAEDSTGRTETRKVPVNTAGIELLQTLPGIGEVYAQRIIAYREANGPFTSFDDLLKVKGIGKKRLEKVKPFIKLD